MNKQKSIIIIVGPTASGKTSLSLELAAHFNTSIISADSRQCFKELNIGVAKPSAKELDSVKHYFINSHSIQENVDAHVFEKYALQAADEIFTKNDIAIMVGGTGMYIKAFCEGLDEMPETNFEIRKEIVKNYKEKGLLWLQSEVEEKDSLFWQKAEQKNPQRLMRALEIVSNTGVSITELRKNNKAVRPFNVIKIGIDLPRHQLHINIENRVEEMIKNGLLEEVKSLQPFEALNALQTVGYKEIFNYLHNKLTITDAISQIKMHTRQYAKRQQTWFKKDKSLHWMSFESVKDFLAKEM